MQNNLSFLIEEFKEHRKEIKERLDSIDSRLEKAEKQLFMYKIIISTLKVVGAVLLALITFKFGDAIKYLKMFLGM